MGAFKALKGFLCTHKKILCRASFADRGPSTTLVCKGPVYWLKDANTTDTLPLTYLLARKITEKWKRSEMVFIRINLHNTPFVCSCAINFIYLLWYLEINISSNLTKPFCSVDQPLVVWFRTRGGNHRVLARVLTLRRSAITKLMITSGLCLLRQAQTPVILRAQFLSSSSITIIIAFHLVLVYDACYYVLLYA